MKKHTKTILDSYDSNLLLYADFNSKCRSLIIDLLKNEGLNYHQITERVKDKNKLEGKILKKGHKYSDVGEITDICGIRIISYFEDEVDKIADIITSEFKVDTKNSIDRRQLETDRFGYRSLHYVVSLNSDRCKLSEYKRFTNLKVEIQIRTILQHSWAEIEHDIGYKGDHAIPEFARRNFYRVAALLETADLEFVNLKNTLKEYEDKIDSEIISHPESVQLDKVSLASYINNNKMIAELDEKYATWSNVPIWGKDDVEASSIELVERLRKVGVTTVKQLDDIIINNSKEIFERYKKETEPELDDLSAISKGIVVYQIDSYLEGKKKSS